MLAPTGYGYTGSSRLVRRQSSPGTHRSLCHSIEEVRQADTQDLGDAAKIQDRKVTLAPLHGADEGAVELTPLSQVGLRPSAGQTALPQAKSQVAKKTAVVKVHFP
jgi:hypothetical protein